MALSIMHTRRMAQSVDELVHTITHLNRLLAKRVLSSGRHREYTQLRYETLRLLTEEPAVSTGELASKLHLTAPSASQHLQRLESHGFIRRAEDAHDRRRSRLYATTKGESYVRQRNAARKREYRKLFSGISLAQLRMIAVVLKRMLRNINYH